MDVPTVASLALSVLGLGGTAYYGHKSLKLEQRIRRYDWADIAFGVRKIGRTAFRDFQPDLMLSLSGPGSIVSNLILIDTVRYMPLYVGISERNPPPAGGCRPNYQRTVATSRWITYVPDDVFRFASQRILICDDCVITGDTLARLVALLVENGFPRENIRTASLFVTELALAAGLGPDVYWMKVQDSEFYLP